MRALVAYASRHGSTAEIAEAIVARMREEGVEAEALPAGLVRSLDGYDAVVLGSAVYMGHWRGDARRFLRRHRKRLTELPFWIFSSGPAGDPAEDRPGWEEPRGIVAKAERLGARGHVVFGGRLPLNPEGLLEKAMVERTPQRYRDRRDWDRIGSWSSRVAAEVRSPRSGRLVA